MPRLTAYGPTDHYNGMCNGFELMLLAAAIQARDKHKADIQVFGCIPLEGHDTVPESEFDVADLDADLAWRTYWSLRNRCDKVIDVSRIPKYQERGRSEMYKARNRYVVDRSDHMIVCDYRQPGGTAHTMGYAKRRGVTMTDVYREICHALGISP